MLRQHITAEIRRMGRRFEHLEALLPSMTEPQLRDLLALLRASKDAGESRVRGRARRMGIPRGML